MEITLEMDNRLGGFIEANPKHTVVTSSSLSATAYQHRGTRKWK
jgi:hypothetical protein